MNTRDTPRPIELLRPLPAVAAAVPVPRPAAPAAGPPQAGGFSLRVVARGVARYWWQALLLWAVGTAGASALVYKKFRPTYEASSLLRVDLATQNPFGESGHASSSSEEVQVETQIQLVTSTGVLRAAAADPRVAGSALLKGAADPAALLRGLLEVKQQPRSYLIRVALTSTSSAEAAAVVNAVVDAYLAADDGWAAGRDRDQIARMGRFRDDLRSQAEERKAAWIALAARGNVDPASAAREPGDGRGARESRLSVSIDEYKKLRGDLIRTKVDLAEAEGHLRALVREGEPGRAKAATPEDLLKDDPDLADLRDRIEAAGDRKDAADRLIRKGLDPAAKRSREVLAGLTAQYQALRATKLEALRRAAPGGAAASPESAPAKARARVAALKAAEVRLEAMLAQLDVANREQATDAVKMSLVQSDLDQIQGMLDEVNKRLEALRFAARGASRTVRIDEARPAAVAAADKRPKMLAMVPAATLLMLVAAATLLEIRAGRVGCPDLLSSRIRAEVFTVPALPAPPGARARRGAAPTAQEFSDRVDHLRVALCDAAAPGRGRSTLITSAVGGEGKTTLAAQLAARCADAGLSTLLIDADLRRATLGAVLGVPDSPGLSDVLGGLATLEGSLVQAPGLNGCWFLPAGTPEASPGRAFQGHRVRALLEDLHRRFDAIIIDAPPVLPVPDALALGRWVDGVILATRHDASRMSLLEQAQKLLAGAGIPLLGVVVNGARRDAASGGGYGYGYASRRAPGSPA